jgi:hypothetical protein
MIEQVFVGSAQQRSEGRRLVGLTGRQVEVQRVPVGIAQQMDLGGKPPAGAA